MTRPKPELILASTSTARAELLRQTGYHLDRVMTPDIDETPRRGELPARMVARLAEAKATEIHGRGRNGGEESLREARFVLAADTAIVLGGRAVDSPRDVGEAEALIRRLSGRAHRVITAVAVIAPDGRCAGRLARARVRFKRLSETEIKDHLDGGEWRGRAGGYAIQGRCGRFAIAISGSYSAIAGLPLYETCCILEGIGYRSTVKNETA